MTMNVNNFATYGAKAVTSIQLEVEVRKVLEDLTNHDATFSAYDVTKALRKEFDNIKIEHADVRRFVHSIMPSYPSYKQTSKDYSGVQAIVYEPVLRTVGTPNPVVSTQPLKLVSQKPDTYVYPKSEGRVTVPSAYLKEIGVTPYDYVKISKNNNLLILSKWKAGDSGPLYSTDRTGAVRLRRNILGGFNKFGVVATKDSVQLVGE
jgi:hypothetical protein